MSVFKLKIIDRLFITQLSKMMLGVMTVVLVILLSQRLVRLFSKVSAGELSIDAVMTLVGLNMLLLAIKIIPVIALLSVLLVLGKMYRDQEMTALMSAGVGLRDIYRSVSMFAVPLFLVTLYLSLVVAPWVMQEVERVKTTDQAKLDVRGISAGRFNEYSRGDLVFYVEEITDDNKMHNVFIQNRQHGKLGVTSSKSGRITVDSTTGDRLLILENGVRYEGTPGQADYKITQFEEYGVVVAERTDAIAVFGVKETSTAALMDMDTPRAISELQRRWSIPLGIISFILLAVPISRVSPRAGMYGNLVTGLLIYIVFENLMSLSLSGLVRETIPVWLGVWWVHALMAALAGGLVVNALGFKYVKETVFVKK